MTIDETHAAPPGAPGFRHTLSLVRRNRDFSRLYAAQLISFGGDWFTTVALVGLIQTLTGSALLVTLVLFAQMVPFAIFAPLGGHLADRFNRKTLMITADISRAILALGLLAVNDPGDVWLAFALVATIAALNALFVPAAQAALPNLVDPQDLPAANVLVGSAWGTMLAVGGALGGIVAATWGRDAAFIGDAVTFAVSASLLVGIRRRFAEERPREHASLAEAIKETVRYARADHRVLALLSVKGGFGLAAGVIGLLPIFALTVFDAGDEGTGILFAARGAGALIGPFLVRRFAGELRTLFLAIGGSFAAYGVFYGIVPAMGSIALAAVFVLLAHLGGGAQWMLSTYGLQKIVPDRIRGRIFSFDYGLVTMTIALSLLVSGWAADRFDPRSVMLVLAVVSLLYAAIWSVLTAPLRRRTFEPTRT